MPSPWGLATLLRFLTLHIHNLLNREGRFCDHPFTCVSLRKSQKAYVAANICDFVGYLHDASLASHSLFSNAFTSLQLLRHCKRYYHIGVSFKAACHQQVSAMKRATSSSFAYRHTSERISQHNINRRVNLSLVCMYKVFIRDISKPNISHKLFAK